ncbi:MAG: restriction endonuclease [Labilithrix sp.]|nr:restriction endonuclease [Labilithrix sp.]MCW5817113.1 restriction endonuclease [Labilithrix sp.]
MTFTEAAAEVLRIAGKPLHYKEITELAIEKNLLSHVGKSPEVTMGARLAALLKKEDKENPIVRVKPGVFALREWDGKKGKKKVEAAEAEAEEAADVEVNALELEARTMGEPDDEDDEPIEVSGEDALRADLAASAAEMFDDEDDDDQPIFSSSPNSEEPRTQGGADARGAAGDDGNRRRRRRRRRRGGRDNVEDRASSPRLEGDRNGSNGERIQPTAILSVEGDSSIDTSRDPLAPAPRPMIRDRQQIMAGGAPTGIDIPPGEQDELSGRELADATVMILSGFDRAQGPVQVRSVVDALIRRGRLGGDSMLAAAQLTASLRADNLRRSANGQRPRFRFGQGPRVALTDWTLSTDLVRLEAEAIGAIERYREASRRMMLRKLQELPGHALIELVLLGLERVGMTNLRTVRRAGAPGGEAHFAATHKTGTDEIKTAIVVRKDGREVGRERVSDLRGALHHYGPASAGWLITTGQVLSGAREESGAPAAPIALFDGVALCRLLEENDVGVLRTRLTTAIPDLELYETLRGGG